jgi:TonB family protein
MARLRVRVELNRRMAPVPLDKMASVIEETRRFFSLLAEDVRIEAGRGEWVASDFDPESLHFTAEYNGPVTADQAKAFGAAFSGTTSLRKATIAQFTRIADFLGEDELVGFGLFQSEDETEPSEWRCLSKRDAVRFGEEIKLLTEAAGETAETQLPAVMSGSVAGRRLFKDHREDLRREREALSVDPSRLIRDMEHNLARRITALEKEVAETRKVRQITDGSGRESERNSADRFEQRFERLLSAMETFWAQAPRQLPLLAAPAAPPAAEKPRRWTLPAVAVACGIVMLAGVALPRIEREWSRFNSVQALPMLKLKTPAAPRVAIAVPSPRPPAPFIGPLIPLDIPASVKSEIQSEVRVNVLVAIDREGNVTGARVASTKGASADLLIDEALRAAKQSRFQPAREGQKTVQSQMLLTFLFKPLAEQF